MGALTMTAFAATPKGGCDPVRLTTTATKDNKIAMLEVDPSRIRSAPRWKPGGGDPPLSVGKAVAALEEWAGRNSPAQAPLGLTAFR